MLDLERLFGHSIGDKFFGAGGLQYELNVDTISNRATYFGGISFLPFSTTTSLCGMSIDPQGQGLQQLATVPNSGCFLQNGLNGHSLI